MYIYMHKELAIMGTMEYGDEKIVRVDRPIKK